MMTWCCGTEMQLQCIVQRAATVAVFPSVSLTISTQDRSPASRIPQNCQILACMHVHTPAHMCVCAILPSSFLPASSLALHQGWWGSVYGKCEESNISCFKISPLTCSSYLPFFHFYVIPSWWSGVCIAEDPVVCADHKRLGSKGI